ncbi:MAG TPA: NAD(P)/FAD-dependent oxidoreductase [Chloroflexia bacterium]|nr:NAD(P)/FAD-dependent oxidoreductase [Chloroflexia bacterium]
MNADGERGAATDYDVIIVGGRPAGATLAARLGQAGLRVLLLERATFPSLPAASCPAIYTGTMAMLDEIGADESDYARNTPQIRRWVTEVRDDYRTINHIPLRLGRDYAYAIDRARFDDALWRTAAHQPGVTARANFSVVDLLRAGERVTGVRGHTPGGPSEVFTAGCVVGADGRFSLVARKVDARPHDVRDHVPTTLYYAYWRHAQPYDADGPTCQIFAPGYAYGFLIMDSADDTLCVAVEGQAGVIDPGAAGAETLYMELLRKHPRVWRRIAQATRVGDVHGMRKVGNLYRAAGGPGWALVGDALHQKDPLDGQGIYDAVFTAKALGQALVAWHRGDASWETALAGYEAAVRAETYPMYMTTIERVEREVYKRQPEWAFKSTLRWISDDPEYKRRLGLLLVRGLADPAHWLSPGLVYRALLRGAAGDARRLLTRQPRSNAALPLASLTS